MTDNSNRTFDLFKNFPTWSTLSPQQQFDYVMTDKEFQRAYLSGDDIVARLVFETATKNLVDHQQAEQAKALAEAKAMGEGTAPKQNPGDDLRSRLNEMAADPEWRKNYFNGDTEAVTAFNELTAGIAAAETPTE